MVSDEQLIEDLQEFAENIQPVVNRPTTTHMDEIGPRSSGTYHRAFGSWSQALKEAGVVPKNYTHYPDKQRLVRDLKRFSDTIESVPTTRDMRHDGPWSVGVYIDTFGSWNRALKEAELEPNIVRNGVTKQKLIKEIKSVSEKLGCTPTREQIDDHSKFSDSSYERYFGSWNLALREAGLEPVREYPVEAKWRDDVDDYFGESWSEMRKKAAQRDNEQCRVCGDDELVQVHHIKPRRCFENPDDSNTLDNLITLCASCHGRFENRWTDTDPDEFEAKARELLSVA